MVICATEVEDGEWLRELSDDKDFGELIKALRIGDYRKEVKLPRSTQKLTVADFMIEDGELKLVMQDTVAKVVPKSRRKQLFEEAHYGAMAGHLNGKKM
ncbi:hypothetical protein Y032_0802g2425 [Ancylostoma ceylanicum]|uniref:Uncharacterized protein n=1 Tax=Ancylostoma ceylanicum TaxID=53326 RepID=A0A016WCH2_9BILA|nr:hypothetical protein Y032_0802g2425 [Ancylostoma ceylanicum]